MLNQNLKDCISSLNESELEEIYDQFVLENGTDDVIKFVRHLFINKHISNDELKKIQNQEQVELSSVSNILDYKSGGVQTGETRSDCTKTAYTILDSIDKGAMGEILIAKDNDLGRAVAYKRIHPHVAERSNFMKRFFMEAQVTAQLEHPNIVPVYGFQIDEEGVGYAMKLIQGETLKSLIVETRKQLTKNKKTDEHHSLAALLDHFLKVCDALHYAHRKGVIHRDLKPLNIMVGPYNEVYLMDWGIAKLVDVDMDVFEDQTRRVDPETPQLDEDKTSIGKKLGTPAYMSPEQARGENDGLDHRSDIFSMGLILFELVTLKQALAGRSQLEIIERASSATLLPPTHYSRSMRVPSQLLAIIAKATQLNPNDRYATVKVFADDVRRYLRDEAISARRDTIKLKLTRWMNKHRVAALNIVVYSVLGSILLVSWNFYQQQQLKIESQLQSQRTGQFLSSVAAQAQVIDSKFLKFESSLQGVVSAAVSLLERGIPDPERYYDYKDFAVPGRAPPDLANSPVYGFPISVGWHAYKLAPGVEVADVENLIRIINPLRHTFRRMILKSHDAFIAQGDDETAARVIRDEGTPLVWTYVGLEEGIFAEYPGKTGYPEAFDARKRPWYVSTLKNEGTSCWRPPYIDVGGRGVLLPCTSRLYNNEGRLLGVAAVEMTLEYIRRKLMAMPGISGIENTYLLNNRAIIVVDSSDAVKNYERGTLINSINDLEIYPNKQVTNNIARGKSGYVKYSKDGRDKILAYIRLNSIGWYYLAEADARSVAIASDTTAY